MTGYSATSAEHQRQLEEQRQTLTRTRQEAERCRQENQVGHRGSEHDRRQIGEEGMIGPEVVLDLEPVDQVIGKVAVEDVAVALHGVVERGIVRGCDHGEIGEPAVTAVVLEVRDQRVADFGILGGVDEVLVLVETRITDDRAVLDCDPVVRRGRIPPLAEKGGLLCGDAERRAAAGGEQVEHRIEIALR